MDCSSNSFVITTVLGDAGLTLLEDEGVGSDVGDVKVLLLNTGNFGCAICKVDFVGSFEEVSDIGMSSGLFCTVGRVSLRWILLLCLRCFAVSMRRTSSLAWRCEVNRFLSVGLSVLPNPPFRVVGEREGTSCR